MPPGRLNFSRRPGDPEAAGAASAPYRGDTFAHELVFTDDGDPFPVVGELSAQIRPQGLVDDAAGTELASFTVTQPESHRVILGLPPEVTVLLPLGWVWDLQLIDAGVTTTLLAGSGRTVNDVTRPNEVTP